MPARSHLWPDPRVKPPYGAAEVNRSHPLANGLRGYYLCRGSGHALGLNLVGASLSVLTSTPASKVGAGGVGLLGNGSSALASAVVPLTGYPFSMVVCAEWDGTGGLVPICGFGNGAFGYNLLGTHPSGALVAEDSGASGTLTIHASPPTNVPFTCGRSSASSSNHRVFYNGGFVTSSTATDSAMGSATNYTLNGVWYSGGGPNLFWSGITYWTAVWARGLSDAEMLWLHAEPYAMLRPIVRRRYSVPPGGSTIPRKMHHYELLRA